ncbi:MAG: phosphoribosylanthranilate isomerase, partial [Anaerolineales bacterium]|nr:phosphoribosylanthranilate isomerase [Anaerolineales bacterium]
SPRSIDPGECAEIVSELVAYQASLVTVGIFVNQDPQRIAEILDTCRLDLAQLCGNESATDLMALEGRAFKAVRPASMTEAVEFWQTYTRADPPALLVDAHVKGAYGGTGETGDWALARQMAAQAPILLAGGLNPDNVAAAVKAVNPWGVDVASGVESSPGVKDPAKISAFIFAARSKGNH